MEESPNLSLSCVIVTPEATVLETPADFVALPIYDGEVGIGRSHSPMIGRLGFGELRIRTGDDVLTYYVDGGFVQVAEDVVSVLTNRALPASEVDPEAADRQLRECLEHAVGGTEEMAIRDRRIAQARGQLRVAARTP